MTLASPALLPVLFAALRSDATFAASADVYEDLVPRSHDDARVAVVMGDDTEADSPTSHLSLHATDVVAEARCYAGPDGGQTAGYRARVVADRVVAVWTSDATAAALTAAGLSLKARRTLALSRRLPVAEPDATRRGHVVSVRFAVSPTLYS